MTKSTIVLVHLGPAIPEFTKTAIAQAALFSSRPICLVAQREALKNFKSPSECLRVACEDLSPTLAHRRFSEHYAIGTPARDFWSNATERFFFLDEVIRELALERVIHLECDVMLYTEADALGERLSVSYEGMAAPFIDNSRCIPSVVFIPSSRPISRLCDYICNAMSQRLDWLANDMTLLFNARKAVGRDVIDALPILPAGFAPLVTLSGEAASEPEMYTQNSSTLDLIFDGAAIGQFLGGTDQRGKRRKPFWFLRRRGPNFGPGFVNESSFMKPSDFEFEWTTDDHRRRVPLLVYGDRRIRIANLHIHSKELEPFFSTR